MKNRLLLALALVTVAFAAVAGSAVGGPKGQLFEFKGTLVGANSTSVTVQIEGGNRAGLVALIGQSQNQTFTIGSGTQILVHQRGLPHGGTVADLQAGDDTTVRIRAPRGSTLQQVEATPAAVVSESHPKQSPPKGPLWLFAGTVTGPQSGGHIALHVTSGNWRALHTMLGQSLDQTFTYDASTIFLLWQGRVPTVIGPSQLKAGDVITIRVRAPRESTLAQVEAIPARHVGDHEPVNPEKVS